MLYHNTIILIRSHENRMDCNENVISDIQTVKGNMSCHKTSRAMIS